MMSYIDELCWPIVAFHALKMAEHTYIYTYIYFRWQYTPISYEIWYRRVRAHVWNRPDGVLETIMLLVSKQRSSWIILRNQHHHHHHHDLTILYKMSPLGRSSLLFSLTYLVFFFLFLFYKLRRIKKIIIRKRRSFNKLIFNL